MNSQTELLAADRFTIVFEGDIRKFIGNPLKTDTPFGVPLTVAVGDLIEKLNELEDSAPAQRTQETKRQYYYKDNHCGAKESTDAACICWHDEGTGPLKDEPGSVKYWRPTPSAAQCAPQPSGEAVACDCGFSAETCAQNPCQRKKVHLARLTPNSKWPNTGSPAVSRAAREAIIKECAAIAARVAAKHDTAAVERFKKDGEWVARAASAAASEVEDEILAALSLPAAGGEASKREADLRAELAEWKQAASVEAGLRREFHSDNERLREALEYAASDCYLDEVEGFQPTTVALKARAALTSIPDERAATTGGGK